MGIDILPLKPGGFLLPAQSLHRIHHLALKPLHQLQRHIKKVAGAAGRIQHPCGAELRMKAHGEAARFPKQGLAPWILRPQHGRLALASLDGADNRTPFAPQRLDERGDDQPLHIGARRVMGAQLAPVVRVQRLFQQRAENGRVHLAPVVAGGPAQFADLLGAQSQHRAPLEELAIEARHLLTDGVGIEAHVHRLPELADIMLEGLRVFFAAFQHLLERMFRQQAHILREHREEAAHQEHRDIFRRICLDLQSFGDSGQTLRDLARHAGRAAGGVKGERIGPDACEELAHGLLPQILQIDAEGAAVGELVEGFAVAAKVGVKLEAMADIADDEEGRRLVGLRQQARIALALRAGVHHQCVPGAADGSAPELVGCEGEAHLPLDLLGAILDLPRLLGLQHEAIALVEVHAPSGDGAVAGDFLHRALEDVIVLAGMARRIRPGQVQRIAELAQEHGVIRPLLPAVPPLPPLYEVLDGVRRGGGLHCKGSVLKLWFQHKLCNESVNESTRPRPPSPTGNTSAPFVSPCRRR